MLVYSILPDGPAPDMHHIPGATVVRIERKPFETEALLPLDDQFMTDRYGFRLSPYECDVFVTHCSIWRQFLQTGAPYCLVMEPAGQYHSSLVGEASMAALLEQGDEWEVLFPFEAQDPEQLTEITPGCQLGYHWGAEVYFLNRRGAEKLLAIPAIRQPVDEEMLTMALEGGLEIFNMPMAFFTRHESPELKAHRNKAVKDAVFASTAWSAANRIKARALLHTVCELAEAHDIHLVVCDGSLLGHIRHGGIMPWDDDIDLALRKDLYPAFSALVREHPLLATGDFEWGRNSVGYCKIWGKEGEEIPGYPYSFPFVDVWFYQEEGEQVVFDSGTVFPRHLYHPFRNGSFEGSRLKVPHDPLACLDISYPTWRSKIYVFPWSHRQERNAFKPLSVDIAVNGEGRML